MLNVVKSVRQFDALINMLGFDQSKKLMLERNKINKLDMEPGMDMGYRRKSFLKTKLDAEDLI